MLFSEILFNYIYLANKMLRRLCPFLCAVTFRTSFSISTKYKKFPSPARRTKSIIPAKGHCEIILIVVI